MAAISVCRYTEAAYAAVTRLLSGFRRYFRGHYNHRDEL
jgi:hypothetical protein